MNIKELKDKFCEILLENINDVYYPKPKKQGANQYHLDIYHAQEMVGKIDPAAFEIYMQEMVNRAVDNLIKNINFKR